MAFVSKTERTAFTPLQVVCSDCSGTVNFAEARIFLQQLFEVLRVSPDCRTEFSGSKIISVAGCSPAIYTTSVCKMLNVQHICVVALHCRGELSFCCVMFTPGFACSAAEPGSTLPIIGLYIQELRLLYRALRAYYASSCTVNTWVTLVVQRAPGIHSHPLNTTFAGYVCCTAHSGSSILPLYSTYTGLYVLYSTHRMCTTTFV